MPARIAALLESIGLARKEKNHRFYAYISLILAVAIWGIATPVIRGTVEYIPPISFLMVRFWMIALVSIPSTIYFLKKIKLNKERVFHILISSCIGYILALIFFFEGLERTRAIDGSLIMSFLPLLVGIMSLFILKELIHRNEIEGTLLAFIGTMIIIFAPFIKGEPIFNGGRLFFLGNLLFLLGVIFDASYSVYIKKYLSKDKILSPISLTMLSFTFAAVVFTFLGFGEQYLLFKDDVASRPPICRMIESPEVITGLECDNYGCFSKESDYVCTHNASPETLTFSQFFIKNLKNYFAAPAILGIMYMSFLSGIVGYIAYQYGLRSVEASEASLFYYLQPVFGIPVAIIFLGESFSPVFLIGSIIIGFGIYLAEKNP